MAENVEDAWGKGVKKEAIRVNSCGEACSRCVVSRVERVGGLSQCVGSFATENPPLD
jgi:hypothetical protein